MDLVLGGGAGLLVIAAAVASFTGGSALLVALLGAGAGLLCVAAATLAALRPEPMVAELLVPEPSGVHDLPPRSPTFVGRRTQIARALLHLRYRTDHAPVLAITGMPGVGRTALALMVAHQLRRSDYPDTQLFIRLGGGQQPLKASEDALYEALVNLGMPSGAVPAGIEQRRNLYLQMLQGTRSLVVLDDASTAGQILELWPPNGCAAIATCRTELLEVVAAGARPMRLRPLTVLQALRFLANRIGRWRVVRQPVAALRLVNLYGRLPLALACVSARLGSTELRGSW